MTIAVNKVVNVNILTTPTFPKRAGFGLLLIVGSSAKLPLGNRIRFYSDMTGVAADFAIGDEEYKAAQIFFSQSPAPAQIAIGRRFTAAAPGELIGGSNAVSNIATWNAITAGSIRFIVDGVTRNLSTMNFSTDTTMAQVAARIQAALIAAGSTGATVTWTGSRFIVRSGTTGVTSTVAYAAATGSGTDISVTSGLDVTSGGIVSTGIALESISAALDALQVFDPTWYGLTLTSEATQQNILDAAAWCEARVKLFGYSTAQSGALDSTSTTDLPFLLKQLSYRRTFGVWDDNDPYAVVSAFARLFVVNFNEQNSTITLKFKVLPGVSINNTITETQRLALNGKNVNYYTYFGLSGMLAEGVTASGVFVDEVHGLDWLQNAIETNVFGYLYTTITKVPQTDKGVARIVAQVTKAMNDAVNNGLIAPGVWNGADLGEKKSGDFLEAGFYVYAQPVALQNQSDREARIAPPIQVIAKGAGAIHNVNVTVQFNR